MTATRAFARALSASLTFGIGVGELARCKPLFLAMDEARAIARVHHCTAYVYRRADGGMQASSLEPELLPVGAGAELVAEVEP